MSIGVALGVFKIYSFFAPHKDEQIDIWTLYYLLHFINKFQMDANNVASIRLLGLIYRYLTIIDFLLVKVSSCE